MAFSTGHLKSIADVMGANLASEMEVEERKRYPQCPWLRCGEGFFFFRIETSNLHKNSFLVEFSIHLFGLIL